MAQKLHGVHFMETYDSIRRAGKSNLRDRGKL